MARLISAEPAARNDLGDTATATAASSAPATAAALAPAPEAALAATSAPAPSLPTRIAPVLDDAGQPLELNPPGGSHWLRDADGGLTPADADTAAAVGLAWPGQPA